jgi:hypothetical protein
MYHTQEQILRSENTAKLLKESFTCLTYSDIAHTLKKVTTLTLSKIVDKDEDSLLNASKEERESIVEQYIQSVLYVV